MDDSKIYFDIDVVVKNKSIAVQCNLSSFRQRYSSSQWSKSVANSLGYASRVDKRTDHVKPLPYWHGFICLIFFLQTSDAYVRVAFCKQSAVTEVLTQTLCPTWDQTLIFDDVEIYESVENVAKSPPSVVVEVFDKDAVVRLHTIKVKSSDTFEILNQKNWWSVVPILDSGQYVCFVQILSHTLKSKTFIPFVMVRLLI